MTSGVKVSVNPEAASPARFATVLWEDNVPRPLEPMTTEQPLLHGPGEQRK